MHLQHLRSFRVSKPSFAAYQRPKRTKVQAGVEEVDGMFEQSDE